MCLLRDICLSSSLNYPTFQMIVTHPISSIPLVPPPYVSLGLLPFVPLTVHCIPDPAIRLCQPEGTWERSFGPGLCLRSSRLSTALYPLCPSWFFHSSLWGALTWDLRLLLLLKPISPALSLSDVPRRTTSEPQGWGEASGHPVQGLSVR